MRKILALFFLLLASPAYAGVTCSLPYTFTNGTIADATQVMANYDALVTCLTNAAQAGANNDITSLSGLTTPITPNQGGANTFIGQAPTASGNEIVVVNTVPGNYANVLNYSVALVAPTTNTGPETMNVNGQGVENIYKQSTAGPVPLTGGEIVSGQTLVARWDGTEYQINPVPSVAAGWGLSQNASQTALQIATTNPPYGYDLPINLELSASVPTTNILQINILNNAGVTPAATSPVLIPFRDPTIANGDPQWVAVTGPLSINTNAIGATLGTANGVPFHLWIVAFDNAGTVVPALFNASVVTPIASAQIFPLDTTTPASTTGIGNGATSAGVFYTPNGISLSSKAFTILGYCSYPSGLTTAGSYATACSKLQLMGAGVKKPGDIVQTVSNFTTAVGTANTGTLATLNGGPTLSITPQSSEDLLRVFSDGTASIGASSNIATIQMQRGTTLIGVPSPIYAAAANAGSAVPMLNYDDPATTSTTTYSFKGAAGAGGGQQTLYYPLANTGSVMEIQEIRD